MAELLEMDFKSIPPEVLQIHPTLVMAVMAVYCSDDVSDVAGDAFLKNSGTGTGAID